MREKLRAPRGKVTYRERKWISDAPSGWIKHLMGLRRFSVRVLENASGKWNLVYQSLNSRRLRTIRKRSAS